MKNSLAGSEDGSCPALVHRRRARVIAPADRTVLGAILEYQGIARTPRLVSGRRRRCRDFAITVAFTFAAGCVRRRRGRSVFQTRRCNRRRRRHSHPWQRSAGNVQVFNDRDVAKQSLIPYRNRRARAPINYRNRISLAVKRPGRMGVRSSRSPSIPAVNAISAPNLYTNRVFPALIDMARQRTQGVPTAITYGCAWVLFSKTSFSASARRYPWPL